MVEPKQQIQPGLTGHRDLSADDDRDSAAVSWDFPLLDDTPVESGPSNALGYAPGWYHEEEPETEALEEEEAPAPQPLTMEEIEAVRQAAYDDGFVEGREEGVAQGHTEGLTLGQQEGYQQGLEQGREEGLRLGQGIIDEQVELWKLMADKLVEPLAQMDRQVEQQLVWLAMRLARALIHHEARTSPDLLLGSLKEAVSLLPCAEEGVTLQLHPDDLQLVQQAFGEDECQRRKWVLETDPTLQRGDLQLLSRTSSIDWMLEERIDALLKNFLRSNLDKTS